MPQGAASNVLGAFAATTGALTGKWFSVPRDADVSQVPVNIDLVSGTGTLVIEGAAEDPVASPPTHAAQLASVTAPTGLLVTWFPFMRFKLTGGTAAVARITLANTLHQFEA